MRSSVIGLTAAALMAAACGALAMPTEPAGSWVYEYLDELRLSSDSLSFFVNTSPQERTELGNILSHVRVLEGPGEERTLYLLDLAKREFRAETEWKRDRTNLFVGEVNSRLKIRSDDRVGSDNLMRFDFYFSEGLALWTYLRATISDEEAHRTETRPWGEHFRAGFDHGGLGYKRGRFSFFAGRDGLAWGIDREMGLLFSGSAPTMDMFKFTYMEDKVLFTSVQSELRRGDRDPWDESIRRYLSAHRLDLKLWPRLTFSFSEVVLYGGEHRGFDPIYLNPVTVFYAEQWNSRSDDNVLLAGDFSLLFPGTAEFRGEILIDDFQYDFEKPHEMGFGVDAGVRNPFLDLYSLLGCSYFHIRNGTYGHKTEYGRYTHENEIIGFPYGPDGDYLKVRFSFSIPREALWTVRFSQRRQGEGRVSDPQDEPPEDQRFPSGTVEKTLTAGFDLSWRPSYTWLIDGGLEWYEVDNVGNAPGTCESGFRAALGVTFNFKSDYIRD
jgi:hypothetical protein